ncbi:MAG: amylo-alpha-1,6-glucosidase [Lachnospiraceae bacterium]|nr:amylo-alpha-1,6-glucosidase [Lachnospiraceae bacterium]
MRFLYGNHHFKSLTRGEESCYLMTNGLGGFSSMTMIGSSARNDHALLMSCEKKEAPNHRYNMVHHLTEKLSVNGREVYLSGQQYTEKENNEDGYLHQTSFSYEIYPFWSYVCDGVTVEKTIVMAHDRNLVGVRYEISNRSETDAILRVTPALQFMPKGHLLPKTQKFAISEAEKTKEPGKVHAASLTVISNQRSLHIQTNGAVFTFPARYRDDFYYAYDARDGRPERGACAMNHCVEFTAAAGQTFCGVILYSTEPLDEDMFLTDDHNGAFACIMREMEERYQTLLYASGLKTPLSQALVYAADSFISYRASTDRETILAGFPFFEDWGRDTMISLPGLCLSTGRFDLARNILDTFAQHCKKGLMPNLFPEGKNEPMYNTADAALLFIITVYEYYRRTKDAAYVKKIWPVMSEIVCYYANGTDYHIYMDEDGLLCAGGGLEQVTWMDVRVGDILPTPRHGKPVEINAYWYNVLKIMEFFQNAITGTVSAPAFAGDFHTMAEHTKASFGQKFWNEEAGCLKDVLSGEIASEGEMEAAGADPVKPECDTQIRCNQIWAVSLPFSVLPEDKEKMVVDTVFRRLYTPLGLRTLDPDDPDFHPTYGGSMHERDMAYHQGTVWVYPLGAYYLAYLKVNHYSAEAKSIVSEQLDGITAALREGCVGQLPEIYDGLHPAESRGCFAQAWSVGEILRVCEILEKNS